MNQLLSKLFYVSQWPLHQRNWHKPALLLLALVCFAMPRLSAQPVLSEGFEQSCNPSSFFSGCVPGWISTSGTPGVTTGIVGVTPFEGNQFAEAYIVYSFHWPTPSPIRGGGVAVNFDFEAGVQYRLTFAYRTHETVQNMKCILTNGLQNQYGTLNFNEPGAIIPAIPAGSQTIYSPAPSATWRVDSIDFTPNSNFSQLWFRGANDTHPPGVPNINITGRFFLDAVGIEIICDPNSGVAAYHFEDANGNAKEHFCFGEQIYLDGSDSQNETRYYIDAWRRPIGSPAGTPFSWAAGLGWTIDQQVGLINLSAAFAAQGYHFEPGFEYQIKLAIADAGCIPWTEVLHEFTLECCDTFIYPGFGLDLVQDGSWGGHSLYVHSYQGYTNMNATHEWIVLASPNEYGGPYTQVYTTTTTGSANFTLYDQVQTGLFYTVIHKVITACDQVCFGKQRYANEFFRDGDTPDSEPCELCGFFDCSILDELCYAPGNIYASLFSGVLTVNWDRVNNATGYTVVITANDPDCCSEGSGEIFQISLSTYRNQLVLRNQNNLDCISIQVAAICGRELSWSEKVCYQPHRPGPGTGDDTGQALSSPVSKTQVFPNPTTNDLNIRFEAPHTGQVQLVDALGRVVALQNTEEALNLSFDLSGQPAGFYWVIAQSGDQVQKFKIVKQ